MAVYANLTVDQGSDFNADISVENETGSIDISNYTYRGQIRKTYSSSTAVDFYTSTNSPASGQLLISLTSAQTSAMKAGRYVYDVEISFVDSNGDTIIERILEGKIQVTPSVTK